MTYWDKDTIQLVQNLNDKLKIDHSKWHKDKGNKYKRSAELISAGLCQLIISCNAVSYTHLTLPTTPYV